MNTSFNDLSLFTPANPQTVSVAGASAAFAATAYPYLTLHSTTDAFYRVNGTAATANGAQSFFIGANIPIDLYLDKGTVITIIQSSAGGNAYITEWVPR